MTLSREEMAIMLGERVGDSLYKMCLQKFHTVEHKRNSRYLVVKCFRVENIIKFMGIIHPKKVNQALWQRNKSFIEKQLKDLLK